VNDSSLVRFLQERFKEFDGKAHTKSLYWDILCNIDIQYLYQNGVRHLMSNADPSNMQSIDSDPELFEGLLLHNSPSGKSAESDRTYAISVKDLRSIGQEVRGQEYGQCLRGYMFNMPLAIVDTVAKLMKKTLVMKENKTNPPSQISEMTSSSKHPSPKKHLVHYEEITDSIRRLMLERRECKKEGLPTDDVDAGIKQLQQERNAVRL